MLSVVISANNDILYQNQIGFASIENHQLLNDSTKFRIGSVTKIFTAAMIFQLIEESKLSLNTRLSDYYPDIPYSEKITVSHLLQHRSGLFSITDDPFYSEFMMTRQSKKKILSRIAGYKPLFMPDDKFLYSNSNYILLGYIIEDILQCPYSKALDQRICKKLNLLNTYYGKKIYIGNNEAISYKYIEGKWHNDTETDLSIPHGAGAIVSSPSDLTEFITALFTEQIISKKSLDLMTHLKDGYGHGLFRFPFNDSFAYGHGGNIDGFVSNLSYFPDDKISVAVTANGVNYPFNDILIGILSIYYNMPYEIPEFKSLDTLNYSLDFKQYIGTFSSSALPLKIMLSLKNNKLFAQATGQSAFPLTVVNDKEFRFDAANLVILFTQFEDGSVNYSQFTLKQAGHQFIYNKE